MRFHYLDVFTDRPYAGNPLAVFIDEGGLTDQKRQSIAREVGFSETTFIDPFPEAPGRYRVRIFSPDRELPFAGHPTLGSADAIARFLTPGVERLVLSLGVGPILVVRESGKWFMDQNPPSFGNPVADRGRVAALLGLSVDDLDPALPVRTSSTGLASLVIPLGSRDALDQCRIDHRAYGDWLKDFGLANLAPFCRGSTDQTCALATRVFVDDTGYYEDPATGSAAGNLTGYLVEHAVLGQDRFDVLLSQGDQIGRPSRLQLQGWRGPEGIRVRVGGSAVPVCSGDWSV